MTEDSTLPREDVAKIMIEPEFLQLTMYNLMDQYAEDMPEAHPFLAALKAYVELYDVDLKEADGQPIFTRQDRLYMSAAVDRILAMGDLANAGHLKKWQDKAGSLDSTHPDLITAACLSRLTYLTDEEPCFQMLEFLNHAASSAQFVANSKGGGQ